MLRYALLLAAMTLLLGCGAQPDALQEKLDAFVAHEMADKDLRAVSLTLIDDQTVRWSGGYGVAQAEAGTRASGETVYRVASVSKLFAAMAVMQQVEAGTLDLDAPIQTYLPDFAPENPFGTPITLRQILSHRSGLVREPPVGHYFDDTEPPLVALVESMNQTRLVYAPETQTKYSNAAVSVAGYAVAQRHNTTFADYAQTNLLAPMGMTRSSFAPRPDLHAGLADGFMWTYDGRTFPAPVFELGMLPAANLYTTTDDLGRFLQMLFAGGEAPGGRVLSPESLEAMWTIPYAAPEQTSGFGLGFFVSDFEGTRRVQHSGVMYGYATRVYALPDLKLGVAAVNTMDATNTVTDRIAAYALRLLRAEKEGRPLPDFERLAPVPLARAEALVGRYEGPQAIEITLHDDVPYLFNGTERHRLKARGDTLVVDDRLAYGYTLLPTGDRLVDGNGNVFTRVEDSPPGPTAPEHEGLIGEYGWDHNVLYILERDDQLWALIEWFFYYPLTPVDGDVYRFPNHGLYMDETLTFTRDANGKATAADLVGVVFPRRPVPPNPDQTFRITPVRPVADLRAEALAAAPPHETGDFRPSDLVDLTTLDPTFRLDVRYATTNNFMGTVFYDEPRVFLQRPAAEALARVQADLREQGFGLILYDGYRPWYVTKMFWEATPEDLKTFVADPASGSRHNRGCAIDLGLVDLATGAVAEMPSGYDEFTARAYADYPGGTAQARWHREVLRSAMARHGFTVYPAEWWHYDYQDWRSYALQNDTFDALRPG